MKVAMHSGLEGLKNVKVEKERVPLLEVMMINVLSNVVNLIFWT